MVEQQFILKSVGYAGENEVLFQSRSVLEGFDDGQSFLAATMPRYSRLFSAPSLKREENGKITTCAWYGFEAGQATPWAALGQTEKVRVANFLRGFVRDLMTAINRSDDARARMVLCWLPILSFEQDLLVVNGHPIVTNWGMVPQGTLEISDKLAHHLMHGLGQFLPEDVDVADVADLIAAESKRGSAPQPVATSEEMAPALAGSADNNQTASQAAKAAPSSTPKSQEAFAQSATLNAPRQQETGASFSPPPTSETNRQEEQKSTRCWMPVLIACIFAFLFLLLLLLPGILIFPNQGTATSLFGDQALRQSETALRARISDLKSELANRSCRAPAHLPNLSGVAPEAPNAKEPARPAPSAVTNVVALLDAATVLIVAGDGVTNMGSGSGFFISPDLIVTNKHVVEASPAGHVIVVNKALGGARKGKVIATSSTSNVGEQDYALVKLLGDPFTQHLKVTQSGDKGQQIYAAGYPSIFMETDEHFLKLLAGAVTSAPDMVLTQGIVTVLQESPSGNRMVLHSADISPGNSGGPLADKCGRVIGVNTFIKTNSEQQVRLNFALKSDSLLTFLTAQGVTVEQADQACNAQAPSQQAQTVR